MERKNYGLVLSGGGGKGAYQIGVWKALREKQMDTWIKAVAGTSAGSLNAMLFLAGDYDNAEKIWTEIRPVQFLDVVPEGYCSRDGLMKLMREKIDINAISNSPIPAYISVTNASPAPNMIAGKVASAVSSLSQDSYERTGEYLLVNGRSKEDITKILLASTAIPIVYDPVEIDGQFFRDGGLYDNIPIRPLLETGVRNLIVVKCSATQECNPYLLSQAETVLQIEPSADIGSLITGTLDFDGRNAVYRMQIGYYDTIRAIEYYDRRMNGFPPSAEEKAQRIAQDRERALSNSRMWNHVESINRNRSKIDDILKKYGL